MLIKIIVFRPQDPQVNLEMKPEKYKLQEIGYTQKR